MGIRFFWLALLLCSAWCPPACQSSAPPPAADNGVRLDGSEDDAASNTCADFNPLRNPYFGDTHIHTALSLDAVLQGTRLTPEDAYRFARGEEVGIQPYDRAGQPLRTLKLERPLDFVAISDHSEFLGPVAGCQDPQSPLFSTSDCELFRDDPASAFFLLNFALSLDPANVEHPSMCGDGAELCLDAARGPWQRVQELADSNTEGAPECGFTAFVAYEWSGSPGSENIHRNVIFRNSNVPELPVSYFDVPYADGLWAALNAQCLEAAIDCDVLAIPHNSNISNGRMFASAESYLSQGRSPSDAAFQARIEPIVEIFQHKGDSECDLSYTNPDEACGFENMPFNNLSNSVLGLEGVPQRMDFVRPALAEGLLIARQLGVNPYEWGIIASTDTHLGTPGAVAEQGHPGHGGAGSPARDKVPEGLADIVAFNPGGLAVVWAEENSRDALFDAMKRRETYGTSGPRIVLRFFGGWDFPKTLCDASDLVAQGYAAGVPMGGRLVKRGDNAGAPTFVIQALKDPGTQRQPGTPLQRIEIIKGWIENGAPTTQVFQVAGNPDNGASVDLTSCTPLGNGSETLCTTWTDPSFDPAAEAFYYVRVLENPTCRWHTYVCNDAQVDCASGDPLPKELEGCCDDRYPKTIQERAWSSPIWYLPDN